MNALKRFVFYSIVAVLMVTSIQMPANSFQQKSKKVLTLAKQSLQTIKNKITNKRFTQAELSVPYLGALLLLYPLIAAAILLKVPYSNKKFLRALQLKDKKTVDDYVVHNRIGPNDYIDDDLILLHVLNKGHHIFSHELSDDVVVGDYSKNVVQKLLDFGADPRLPVSHSKSSCSVVDRVKSFCDERTNTQDPMIFNMLDRKRIELNNREQNLASEKMDALRGWGIDNDYQLPLPNEISEIISGYARWNEVPKALRNLS